MEGPVSGDGQQRRGSWYPTAHTPRGPLTSPGRPVSRKWPVSASLPPPFTLAAFFPPQLLALSLEPRKARRVPGRRTPGAAAGARAHGAQAPPPALQPPPPPPAGGRRDMRTRRLGAGRGEAGERACSSSPPERAGAAGSWAAVGGEPDAGAGRAQPADECGCADPRARSAAPRGCERRGAAALLCRANSSGSDLSEGRAGRRRPLAPRGSWGPGVRGERRRRGNAGRRPGGAGGQ